MEKSVLPIDDIDPVEKETRSFVCPNCHAHLQFMVRVQVFGVKGAMTGDEVMVRDTAVPVIRSDRLSAGQRELLDRFKLNGVFQSFVSAVKASSVTSIPSDLEAAFFKSFEIATRTKAPQFAIRLCLPEEDRTGNLELWKCALVSIVIRDGEVLIFLPNGLTEGGTSGRLEVAGDGVKVGDQYQLTEWVKTRFGYVARKGLFLSELRKKSPGAFSIEGK